MQLKTNSAVAAACLLCSTACLGCNRAGGPERVLVSGAVSYNGQPVQEGRVRFVPTSAEVGPVSIAFVKEGRYTTSGFGGVPVGRHRIEILAYDPTELANRGAGFGRAPLRQLLPPKYNKQSDLALDIPAGSGPISHDFVLD